MYENSIKLLRFSDQERAVKGETGEACAAPNHGVMGLWMNREKTDFWTCGPWSGGTSVTLRLLEWAAGRWCHAAEELLGCRSRRAA